MRFDNQATIHPRLYLQGLERAFVAMHGQIFEDTQVVAIDEGDPCRVISDRGVVSARDVIVAAHVPIVNRFLLHAKLAAYRTYVLGIELGADAGVGDGLYWDMAEPYHYLRAQAVNGRRYLLVGGEDHKVGEADDTTAPFERLEAYVRVHFGRDVAPTDYRWSGQIVASADGLPYVGRNSLSHDVYVATGYAGNGITQGTLAATVLADEICGVANPFGELLDATRIKPLASAGAVLSENLDYPRHMLADRLGGGADGVAALGGDPARRGARAVARRRAAGGVPQRERAARSGVAGVHAPRLRRSLEHHREELGLPVPRQPLRSARARVERSGGGRPRGEANPGPGRRARTRARSGIADARSPRARRDRLACSTQARSD